MYEDEQSAKASHLINAETTLPFFKKADKCRRITLFYSLFRWEKADSRPRPAAICRLY